MIDIVKIKQQIENGNLTVEVHYGNVLLRDTRSGEAISLGKHIVYAETVGQYTGQDDNYGVKIFDGDIVNILTEIDEIGVIRWCDNTAMFVIDADDFTANFDNYFGRDLEVIGNIHDNPEMVEAFNEM